VLFKASQTHWKPIENDGNFCWPTNTAIGMPSQGQTQMQTRTQTEPKSRKSRSPIEPNALGCINICWCGHNFSHGRALSTRTACAYIAVKHFWLLPSDRVRFPSFPGFPGFPRFSRFPRQSLAFHLWQRISHIKGKCSLESPLLIHKSGRWNFIVLAGCHVTQR